MRAFLLLYPTRPVQELLSASQSGEQLYGVVPTVTRGRTSVAWPEIQGFYQLVKFYDFL